MRLALCEISGVIFKFPKKLTGLLQRFKRKELMKQNRMTNSLLKYGLNLNVINMRLFFLKY